MLLLFLFATYNMKFYTNTNFSYQLRAEGTNIYTATSGGLSIFSQTDPPFAIYTNTDGLPSNWCRCIEIDKDKNIWVGTDNGIGILKPDHSTFVLLPKRFFPSPKINSIHARDDTVYVGTQLGLLFINTRNTLIDTTDDERKIVRTSNGLFSDTVLAIVANNYIWVGTFKGITRFNKSFDFPDYFLNNHQIKAILVKDTINVYVGTDKGLYVFNGTNFDTLASGWVINDLAKRNDSLFFVIPSDFIIYKDSFMVRNNGLPPGVRLNSVTLTPNGWAVGLGNAVGTNFDNFGEGIAIWDNGQFNTYKRDCLPSNRVADIAVASNGQLFLALGPRGGIDDFRSGVAILKPDSSWLHVTTPTIPTDMVHRCAADNVGRVWFGGNWEGGLFFYDTEGDSWVSYDPGNSGMLYPFVWDVAVDEHNNVLIETGDPSRVLVLDSSLSTWYSLNPTDIGQASDMDVRNGKIYVAVKTEGLVAINTGNTLFDTKDDAITIYSDELPSANCQGVRIDRENRAFIATENGLAVIMEDSLKIFNSKNSNIINDDCLALTIDSEGRVWILTIAGISIYSPYLSTWQRLGFSENNLSMRLPQERLDNKAFIFDPIHHCIWFGSRSGLLKIELSEPETGQLDSILVYPNPLTRNDHALIFKKVPSDATIYIFSLSGRLIKKLEDFDHSVNGFVWFNAETELNSGMYFALVKSYHGKKILKFAVVK